MEAIPGLLSELFRVGFFLIRKESGDDILQLLGR